MRRNLMLFFLIFIFSIIALLFAPWWSTMLIAFVAVLFINHKSSKKLCYAFLAGFCAWFTLILWKDIPNQHILSTKIALLFKLPNATILIIVNGLIGGMTALIGAWIAISLQKLRSAK